MSAVLSRCLLPTAIALAAASPALASPVDDFFAALSQHCGKAYAGRLASTDPADKEAFGDPAVMHVRECSEQEIRIPLHIGENRSRTWILTRTGDSLRLEHDHRHEDGSEDRVNFYGGETLEPGTATRQEFPADTSTKAMFEREGLAVSVDNVWAMEIHDGQFAYELNRPNRHFRLEFDLSQPVTPPPPPWGAD